MRTGILTCLIAGAAMIAGAAAADAATNVDINIGNTKGISCNTGRHIVEGKGYINVRARDCNGEIYVYSGIRNGKNWWIEVRRRDGKVIDTVRR
ncbi:MAG: hypothetical protein JNJ53_12635 [Rhizobiales bacterium]|nr:hypothetical protein [Hyphomicrobiales bacterium]